MSRNIERYNPNTSGPEIKRNENTTVIQKEGATYTIMYGVHTEPMDVAQLPERFDGLFLETGMLDGFTAPERAINFLSLGSIQFRDLVRVAGNFQKPVYLYDFVFKESFFETFLEKVTFPLACLETFTPLGVLLRNFVKGRSRQTGIEKKSMTRRYFLRAAKAVATGWLLLPITDMASYLPPFDEVRKNAREASYNLNKLAEKLHPELYFFPNTLRDCVAAYKNEWLVQQKGGNLHTASAWGGRHTGLEDQIANRSLEEKLSFLRRVAETGVLELAIEPIESFYAIQEFNFDGVLWRVGKRFEIPELKELVVEQPSERM